MKIGLDIMGGDRAPEEMIEGALLALKEYDIELYAFGDENLIKQRIPDAVVVSSFDDLMMDSKPMEVLRKKNSSMHLGLQYLREGKIDAFVSAGGTGPLFLGATSIVGKIEGIERPALAVPVPSTNGFTVLIDNGANVSVRAKHLLDFAIMGIAYAKVLGRENPKVGLLNVGEEEIKGTDLVKEAYALLKEKLGGEFYGNVEGRDINTGVVDVVVTDGFTGNIAMKTMEGVGKLVSESLKKSIKSSGFLAMLGALLMKKAFDKFKKLLDPSEYGGAFILGVNGVVVKAHGNSDRVAIKNAVRVAINGAKMKLVDLIRGEIQ
ncbi:MAG: phosphate acyltransferase PlsX [Thermotogaceae bacterium]|nr:phosphate acyltransferase PlsX [Thermotogaceae bacterium]